MKIESMQSSDNTRPYTIIEKPYESGKADKANENSDKISNGNIQANDLNLVGQQHYTLKKLLAQRAALKVQMDQFEKDSDIDDKLKGHADKRDLLLEEAQTNQNEANRLHTLKENLKETYGIDDNSKEQKDMELLEKKFLKPDTLTKDEEDRLTQLGTLTEYQKEALKYVAMADIWQKRADDAREESINENRTIDAIKLQLLKSCPMIEAKEEAEGILKQVDDEIQKALLEELKEKVNENLDIDSDELILLNPQKLIYKKKVSEEDLKGLTTDEHV